MNTEVFTVKPNTGKWTQVEHEAFQEGFDKYGNTWHMISTIVTTQTSTQIRNQAQTYHSSLLPDSRACMLKNNAEAQQKYRDSLSADTKACILKSDSVAHQKCRESLSPDTKVCIQESDTTAHPKNRESLSPDTKACMLKINAKEQQKH